MNPKSIFHILLFLAPVAAVMYYLISMKQEIHHTEMKQESAKFDADFAQDKIDMSFGDTEHWKKAKAKAEKELAAFSKENEANKAKNDALDKDMEKSLNEMDMKDLKGK